MNRRNFFAALAGAPVAVIACATANVPTHTVKLDIDTSQLEALLRQQNVRIAARMGWVEAEYLSAFSEAHDGA